MSNSITLEFNSATELLKFCTKHLNDSDRPTITGTIAAPLNVRPAGVTLAAAADAEVEAPKPTKKAPKKVEASEDSDLGDLVADNPTAKAPEAKPVKAAKVEPKTGKLDLKTDVRPVALKLLKAPEGSARMRKIFDDFGVNNMTELTGDQYQPYLDAVNAELEAE